MKRLPVDLIDVGLIVGLVSVIVGLAMVWVPAAFIVPGLLVLGWCGWLALLGGGALRRRNRER